MQDSNSPALRATSTARPSPYRRKLTFTHPPARKTRRPVVPEVSMLERAEEVASWGIGGVFPLHWITSERVCSCGKPNLDARGKEHGAGKHPLSKLVPHGHREATTDPEKITEWWSECPDANIGLALAPGIGAIDIDPRHGGTESLAELVEELGPLPETRIHQTGRGPGSIHLIFDIGDLDFPQGAGVVAPGIDTRTSKGFLVAPFSRNIHGLYTILSASAPAKLPQRWGDHFAAARKAKGARTSEDDRVEEGGRNNFLTSVAGRWRRAGMEREPLFAALLAENDRVCRPPLDVEEVQKIAASVATYEVAEDPQKAAERMKEWADSGEPRRRSRKPPTSSGPYMRMASEVQPERVFWLWQGWIPAGKLAVLDGDPSLGKSTLSIDLASHITTGAQWPDGSQGCVPGGVVLCSAEDGAADTIVPRLLAAGADLERVAILDGVQGGGGIEPLSLPEHVEIIRQAVAQVDAKLVVVDPLMAYLGAGTNSFRDQDVRRTLRPMAELADQTGVTILIIRHLNKATGGSAIYRGGGSIGIIGAARLGMLVATDPDDDTRRILAVTKSNLAAKPQSLTYELQSHGDHGAARVEWGKASALCGLFAIEGVGGVVGGIRV